MEKKRHFNEGLLKLTMQGLTQQKHSDWLLKKAAVCRALTQEQVDAVSWVLGYSVSENNKTSDVKAWTPETLTQEFEKVAADYKARGE